MNTFDKVMTAHRALDDNDLPLAKSLVLDVEAELQAITDPDASRHIRANLGGVMIDLGLWTQDESLTQRGTQYAEGALTETPEDKQTIVEYYNAANGYLSLWQMRLASSFASGQIDQSYLRAKELFRQGLDLARSQSGAVDRRLHTQLLVNYANCLNSIRRIVDAISYYDRALKLDQLMGEALGNKAIELDRLAFLAHGHTHTFLLEAHRLLGEALKRPLHPRAVKAFKQHYDDIASVIARHKEMNPEEVDHSEPVSPFHDFLRKFCVKHELYLTPTTFIGDRQTIVHGDPMFISRMTAPLRDRDKFDRYITFLNQIKHDYVTARYFLVQSQYRSEVVDVIDRDVALYYPLDYSLHSAYIQLLKTSMRLAADVLDKIAFFIRDYCNVSSVSKRGVNFRNIWSDQDSPQTLRPELVARRNILLLAFLDLALDLSRDGHYGHIYDHRNALTHRFLIVHDMILSGQTNPDIPRILLSELVRECITVMQIARNAVMYLILFVDIEEDRASKNGLYGPIYGTPIDDVFRWVPPQRD